MIKAMITNSFRKKSARLIPTRYHIEASHKYPTRKTRAALLLVELDPNTKEVTRIGGTA
jgi:hypothetical protein